VLAHSTATAAEIHLPELDQALSMPELQASGTQGKDKSARESTVPIATVQSALWEGMEANKGDRGGPRGTRGTEGDEWDRGGPRGTEGDRGGPGGTEGDRGGPGGDRGGPTQTKS